MENVVLYSGSPAFRPITEVQKIAEYSVATKTVMRLPTASILNQLKDVLESSLAMSGVPVMQPRTQAAASLAEPMDRTELTVFTITTSRL